MSYEHGDAETLAQKLTDAGPEIDHAREWVAEIERRAAEHVVGQLKAERDQAVGEADRLRGEVDQLRAAVARGLALADDYASADIDEDVYHTLASELRAALKGDTP